MKVAVLSGKGGTGKTLISVNLAAVAGKSTYIDCDVEEPNGRLFFKPVDICEHEVSVKIPEVDNELCNGCRKCVEFCKFNALAYIKDRLIIFDEICHSCGGCVLVCPEKALTEKERVIGTIEKGVSENVTVITGILNTGEASGVPIINNMLNRDIVQKDCGPVAGNAHISEEATFVDCPPGSACIVMESIKDSDYCILVAEPTMFGAHNLAMVYELIKLFHKKHGVVLNKCLDGYNPSEEFCRENNIRILSRIPFDSRLGTINSNGLIAAAEDEKYRGIFKELLEIVIGEVQNEAAVDS